LVEAARNVDDFRLVPCEVGAWESFYPGQRWAEPDLEHAAWQLRRVFESFSETRERAELVRQRIRAQFSQTAVIPSLLQVLGH